MFGKKKILKRQPVGIKIRFIDIQNNVEQPSRYYDIPEGGKYDIHWNTKDLKIWNAKNEIIKRVCFQAGYTKEFEFIYSD